MRLTIEEFYSLIVEAHSWTLIFLLKEIFPLKERISFYEIIVLISCGCRQDAFRLAFCQQFSCLKTGCQKTYSLMTDHQKTACLL